MMRNTIRTSRLPASAEPIALIVKRTAAARMMWMRLNRSASGPAYQAPTAQPSRAELTAKPSSPELAWNWSSIAVTAPLITEVSKPKRKPPRAATHVMAKILRRAWPGVATAVFSVKAQPSLRRGTGGAQPTRCAGGSGTGIPKQTLRYPCEDVRDADL